MGYFKNALIDMQEEIGDRKPMIYVSSKMFWTTIVAVWIMAVTTGFMIGVIL